MKGTIVAALGVVGLGAGAAAQQSSVVNGPHNLSATGAGPIRAAGEDQVCIFCHTPHNAAPIRPLWNRQVPVEAYAVYTSRALDARPDQPTGVSKMCLSCHDGTIALGSVISRGTPIQMAGGITTLPHGASNLGTDLSDDHPISFRYDTSLASRDPKVRPPTSLPPEIRLDHNSELQCTSCHDAHNNALGDFLVMRNAGSELCVACHQVGTTSVTAHTECSACHQPHTAPSGPYLLKGRTVADTCLTCHDGSVHAAQNIAADLRKPSTHDTGSPVDPPEPLRDHASCVDCHEPHTMGLGGAAAPTVHPSFGRIGGVNLSGSPVQIASAEFEACFKCHADSSTTQPAVPRRIVQNNTRLEFSPSAISYHPVAAPARGGDAPSLRPGWTAGNLMHCSQCHAADTGRSAGGTGPSGTHGSSFTPLLSSRYETADYTSESATVYALCYSCHDRASILSDESFAGHRLHIVEQRTSCSACHDAHGIASSQGSPTGNTHLINFASDVVFADPATGRLEFRDTGRFSGECFLSCHGRAHSPERYPGAGGDLRQLLPGLPRTR